MIEPPGQIAADSMLTYLIRARAWDQTTGYPLPADVLQIQGVRLMPATDADGMVWGTRLLSAAAGAMPVVTPQASGNYNFDVQARVLDLQLAADNNRDGHITFDQPGQTNADKTSAAKPYRFWINDSKESGDIVSGADAQIPGAESPNCSNDLVQGLSDVVNFFPVALCLSIKFDVARVKCWIQIECKIHEIAINFLEPLQKCYAQPCDSHNKRFVRQFTLLQPPLSTLPITSIPNPTRGTWSSIPAGTCSKSCRPWSKSARRERLRRQVR